MSNLTTEVSNPTGTNLEETNLEIANLEKTNLEEINLEEAIAAKVRELPRERQQQVLDFAEFLLLKLQQPEPKIHNYHPGMSAYDMAKDYAGCLGDGPADLSTNPKYMEGFGQ